MLGASVCVQTETDILLSASCRICVVLCCVQEQVRYASKLISAGAEVGGAGVGEGGARVGWRRCSLPPYTSSGVPLHLCAKWLWRFADCPQVNMVGTQEQMPLLLAVDHGHFNMVQLLVEHGVDVNAQSTDTGSSALHEAARGEERAIVTYLTKNGADKTLRNNSGETPFDLAKSLECRRWAVALG